MHGSRRTRTFLPKKRGYLRSGSWFAGPDMRLRTKWTAFLTYRRTFSSLKVIAPAPAAQCVVLDATLNIPRIRPYGARESTEYRFHTHTIDRFALIQMGESLIACFYLA